MIAGLIFVLTYAAVAAGGVSALRLDRTGAVLVGAMLMVVCRVLSVEDAWRAIDARTLVLIFGMMIVLGRLRQAGFFRRLASAVLRRVPHPAALLVAVVATSGVASALFLNDVVCLAFTPVVIAIARARRRPALPYLLGVATASNIGSVATIVGNPQNMLIGSLSRISFAAFAGRLAPVAAAGLAVDAVLLCWLFRGDLRREVSDETAPDAATAPEERAAPLAGPLALAGGVLAAFLLGIDPAIVALGAAAVVLLMRPPAAEPLHGRVDWDLLILFAALFVVVGGIEHAGLVDRAFRVFGAVAVGSLAGMTVAVAALSNLISNVPAVMVFAGLVPRLPHPAASWLVLAMASTLAGNLTLLGSIANLIVVESARRHGETVGFAAYARVGVPVTLATLALGVCWMYIAA